MPADSAAFERLEMESHSLHLELSTCLHADTTTGAKYQAIYNNYIKWWAANAPDLLAKHEIEAVIPALLITAMKVSFFLQHEITREKRKHGSNETIAGSSLGMSHISGVINALEKNCKNFEHMYKQDPEAQKKLRDDARISEIERSVRHNEPRCNETANALKAGGTSSDAYTPQDLQKCSLWCLSTSRTADQVFLHLRDRAMLLVSAGTAFRGDSTRNLEWSDLFITQAPMPDISPDSQLQVLGILSDNAKHNQQGRVDEHGLIRHRLVKLCPVGALAWYFWAYFHVLSKPMPDFTPDFNDKEFGEFGRRDWYSYHLFYGKDISKGMTYENHHQRMKHMHLENDISISKVTHASRHYGAQNTRSYGASIASTKAMGG
ncbi:hypothetical protein EWM64_g9990 [Hericium alpestre]|uniref:Ndc10 domain-containing protein n=1 Tax=Hericium alpestre TaxID=135208 RepID=A0A4Y9ZHX4_9AGAM|nr:hypothetical protein EWM64_g9990 [Hericium alpestre]